MHRESEIKEAAVLQLQDSKSTSVHETITDRFVADPELMKSERRKKATMFLDQMKRDKAAGKLF